MTAGVILVVCLLVCCMLLFVRLVEHGRRHPPNQLLVGGAAILAAGITYRCIDALQHLEHVRWSSAIGAFALLVFLVTDYRDSRRRHAAH